MNSAHSINSGSRARSILSGSRTRSTSSGFMSRSASSGQSIGHARQLEKIVKGFANYRRIEILELIKERPELSLNDISKQLRVNLKTTSEHLRRMTISGLVIKKSRGQSVLHRISPLGDDILKFLRKINQ